VKSERINKEGETIPSVVADQYQYNPHAFDNWRDRHGYHSDMGIMGGSCNDDEWDELENKWVKKKTCSVLSDSTSLGSTFRSDLNREIIQDAKKIHQESREHTQDGLNRYLTQLNRFTIGDYVTFTTYPSKGPMVTWTTISFVLAIERDVNKVVWMEKENIPKPFLLLDLTPMLPNSGVLHSARFTNALYCRHLTSAEMTHFVRDNVQLQNYIQQARESLKAGTLTIRS
jgi:hypothetical protein